MTTKPRKWNKNDNMGHELSRKCESSAHFNTVSVHPSFPLMGSLESIPAASRREARRTLDELPALPGHTCRFSACVQPVLDCILLNVCRFPPAHTSRDAPWWSQASEL